MIILSSQRLDNDRDSGYSYMDVEHHRQNEYLFNYSQNQVKQDKNCDPGRYKLYKHSYKRPFQFMHPGYESSNTNKILYRYPTK